MNVITMKTGQAVPRSGAKGKKPIMMTRQIIVRVDTTARDKAAKSKYLPHNGERKAAREIRNHQKRAK